MAIFDVQWFLTSSRDDVCCFFKQKRSSHLFMTMITEKKLLGFWLFSLVVKYLFRVQVAPVRFREEPYLFPTFCWIICVNNQVGNFTTWQHHTFFRKWSRLPCNLPWTLDVLNGTVFLYVSLMMKSKPFWDHQMFFQCQCLISQPNWPFTMKWNPNLCFTW